MVILANFVKKLDYSKYCYHYKYYHGGVTVTHHCEDKAGFLDTLCFHHLKHIHYTLSLTAVNGGSYGTEHARPTDSVTGQEAETHIGHCHVECDIAADLQWTTMGLLSVLRCTLNTSSTTAVIA